MEPVKNWQFGDAGIDENAPEPRTTVGEGGHRRVLGAPNGVEFAADQRFERRIGFGDGAENPPASNRFGSNPGCRYRRDHRTD
jgi:hypothetical protein